MRPSKRYGVNKRHSAKAFRRGARRTKGANLVMRGGIRL